MILENTENFIMYIPEGIREAGDTKVAKYYVLKSGQTKLSILFLDATVGCHETIPLLR